MYCLRFDSRHENSVEKRTNCLDVSCSSDLYVRILKDTGNTIFALELLQSLRIVLCRSETYFVDGNKKKFSTTYPNPELVLLSGRHSTQDKIRWATHYLLDCIYFLKIYLFFLMMHQVEVPSEKRKLIKLLDLQGVQILVTLSNSLI